MSAKQKQKPREKGDYFRFSGPVKKAIRAAKRSTGWSKKKVVETAILASYG